MSKIKSRRGTTGVTRGAEAAKETETTQKKVRPTEPAKTSGDGGSHKKH